MKKCKDKAYSGSNVKANDLVEELTEMLKTLIA